MAATAFLPGTARAKYMRYDTAVILKRLFLVEKALVIAQAGWLPGIADFQLKTALPRILWQDAMTADALRERVFELRFPSRMLEVNEDQALIDLIEYAQAAPSALAFVMTLSRCFKPALQQAYEAYLALADEIGDGPTYRFMRLAISEKRAQIAELEDSIRVALTQQHESHSAGLQWLAEIEKLFEQLGGLGLDAPTASVEIPRPARPLVPDSVPARDEQFQQVRFYWPDIVDASLPYGDGYQLQLRSAISHLNEVWAVENAGHVLFTFAPELGWEFVRDAARWVYDESRHTRMGYERLLAWGFEPSDLPLGTYIYDSCRDQDPIVRLGMLFYFESKNIGKKLDRKKSFESMSDRTSEHDMDFDWADESIHTSYGKIWLSAVLKQRGEDPADYTNVKQTCEELVRKVVDSATEQEVRQIRDIAERILAKAALACH